MCTLMVIVQIYIRQKPTADCKSLSIITLERTTSGHALQCLQHLHSYIPAVNRMIVVGERKLHTDLLLKAERVMAP